MYFQAIDYKNNAIEIIYENKKAVTLLGAAQAWLDNFKVIIPKEFSRKDLKQAWIEDEAEKLKNTYNCSYREAYQEAKKGWDNALFKKNMMNSKKEENKFLKDNEGNIWTRSYSENNSKTDEQLRYGTPKDATHLIGRYSTRFWVAYKDQNASDKEVEDSYYKAIGK